MALTFVPTSQAEDRKATAIEVRKRLFEDFPFWAAKCAFIRTKEATIAPLKLNRAQLAIEAECRRQMAERGYVRIVLLKGRQMGSSTYCEAKIYWHVSQREAQKALVVAHDKPATANIFTMTRRLHSKMPDALRPQTARSSTTELVFDKLDSAYRIATAGGEGIVRGDTLTAAHLSEIGWWPSGSAQNNFSGLMDAVPKGRSAKDTMVFIESTANGFNLFYEIWRRATLPEGDPDKSDFVGIFLPWHWDPTCFVDPPKGFVRSPAEEELAERVLKDTGDILLDGHLQFRRLVIAEKGLDLTKQEYPSFPEEAFLTSGAPVFSPERTKDLREKAHKPLYRMTLMPSREWEKSPLGELKVYVGHDSNETYYIGGDVGKGVRKDASVLQVLDSKRRQVAVWASARHSADWFGTVAAALARLYNDAYLAVELNGPGILTNRVIHIDEHYQNYHVSEVYDRIVDETREEIGFQTTEKTKPLIIEELRAVLRDREIEIYDLDTLAEMDRFVILENGKYGAEKGHHDDHVISLAIANHVNDGEWKPYETRDSDYMDLDRLIGPSGDHNGDLEYGRYEP